MTTLIWVLFGVAYFLNLAAWLETGYLIKRHSDLNKDDLINCEKGLMAKMFLQTWGIWKGWAFVQLFGSLITFAIAYVTVTDCTPEWIKITLALLYTIRNAYDAANNALVIIMKRGLPIKFFEVLNITFFLVFATSHFWYGLKG